MINDKQPTHHRYDDEDDYDESDDGEQLLDPAQIQQHQQLNISSITSSSASSSPHPPSPLIQPPHHNVQSPAIFGQHSNTHSHYDPQHQDHHRRRHHHKHNSEFNWGLPIVLALLVVCGYLIFVFIMLPGVVQSIFWAAVNHIIWHFIVVNIVISYWRCCRTDPGRVPIEWKGNVEDNQFGNKELRELAELEIKRNGKPRYCSHCSHYKPPRTHHCRVLNRCVLRMDHYCVWVNNCVGAFNHKFFYLFLMYASMGILYYLSLAVTLVVMFAIESTKAGNAISAFESEVVGPIQFIFVLLFTLVLFPVGLMVCMFFGFHSYLLVTNQTTIEYHENDGHRWRASLQKDGRKFQHIYNTGLVENLKAVLGPNPLLWFLPTYLPASFDGIHYKSISEGVAPPAPALGPSTLV